MAGKSFRQAAPALAMLTLALALAACVCRPVRIDMDEYHTPTNVAELKATLP